MKWNDIVGLIVIAVGAAITFGAAFISRKLLHDEQPKTSLKSMVVRIAGFVLAALGLIIMTQF